MDTITLATFQVLATLEEDYDEADEDQERVLLGVAAVAAAIPLLRANQRNSRRLYLTRPDLLPNPRYGTPWQRLYASKNDRAFITTMGFDVSTFQSLLDAGFGRLWYATPLPRSDVSTDTFTRPTRRSLDAEGALGLVLHYLSSTMREISLQEIFALIPSTTSRYLNLGLQILRDVLRSMPDAQIRWPKHHEDPEQSEFVKFNNLIRNRHPLLTGAFASIDGLNLPVQTSGDEEIENATYNGWKSSHFVSSVLVYAPDGTSFSFHFNKYPS
jgi:hypothetical protein